MRQLQHPASAAAAAHRAAPAPCRRLQRGARRAAATPLRAQSGAGAAAAPSRDATADLMQAAVEYSLRVRLKEYDLIEAKVDCDAMGVLEGRFRSMAIAGEGWRTPLGMTARRLEVDISGLHVDYGTLLTQRKVALKGPPPRGTTTITLTAADLGAFTQHPLFLRAAATAVEGKAFTFDPASTVIKQYPGGGGEVLFEGTWAGDGQRYRVLMQPGSSGGGGAAASSSGGAGAASGAAPKKLRVGAQQVPQAGAAPDAAAAKRVAAGIADFFTSMFIDLDGIEISKPMLGLRPWQPGGSSKGGGGEGAAAAQGVLDISMKVRIRHFPPVNMQF